MRKQNELTEHYIYGTFIAQLMADKLKDEDGRLLDEWLQQSPANMQLFEDLANPWKWRWAKQWFRDHGVSTKGIKWKNLDGWHKPDRKNMIDFYIVMAAMFLFLALVYILLEQ